MKLKSISVVVAAALMGACAPVHHSASGTHPHGFEMMGQGIGQLILSPFMIVAGLLEGLAMIPYYAATDIHAINDAMVEQDTAVNLARTYRYAYEEPLPSAANPGTGTVYRNMRDATRHFQQVLRGYGVDDAHNYLLTAQRSADRAGYTLYAVVHRPSAQLRVEGNGVWQTLSAADEGFYRAARSDASGRSMDVIIDWAGVPRTSIKTQKGQAILMTLAANSVLVNRRSDDYWHAESRWRQGDYAVVVAERKRYLDRRLGLEQSPRS